MAARVCWYGNHETGAITTVNGVSYCQEHGPPGILAGGDPPKTGRCSWHGGHGPIAVWRVPLDGGDYCAEHLYRLLVLATWPRSIRKAQ